MPSDQYRERGPGGVGIATFRIFEFTDDAADKNYPSGWYFQMDDEVRLGFVYGPYEAETIACKAALAVAKKRHAFTRRRREPSGGPGRG